MIAKKFEAEKLLFDIKYQLTGLRVPDRNADEGELRWVKDIPNPIVIITYRLVTVFLPIPKHQSNWLAI